MNRENLAIIGDRLNNMPPLYELVHGGRGKDGEVLRSVVEAQNNYLVELKNVVIRLFNEITTLQDYPKQNAQDLISGG